MSSVSSVSSHFELAVNRQLQQLNKGGQGGHVDIQLRQTTPLYTDSYGVTKSEW